MEEKEQDKKELKRLEKEKKLEEKIYKIRKETAWKKTERWIIKHLILTYYKIVYRLSCENYKELKDTEGAVIICANHVNLLDGLAIGCISKKKVCFVAKEELYHNRFINWLFHIFDIIPVKRGEGDVKFIKNALFLLKNGEVLGIFPEGTRKGLEKGEQVHNGASYLSVKTKTPVIPVGVVGSFKPFTKVVIRYGKKMDLEKYNKDNLDDYTKDIMDNIIMLTKNTK